MNTIDIAWYSYDDQVSPHTFTLSKEKTEKDNEIYENKEKTMKQHYILSKI